MNENKQQTNIERLKNYSDALYRVILERYKILLQISTLSVALVGLVTQATNLVKVKNLALISFIILLALIPLSVFGILYQLGCDAKILSERIESISQPTKNQTETNNFMNIFPWIIFFFFSISIVLVILSFLV